MTRKIAIVLMGLLLWIVCSGQIALTGPMIDSMATVTAVKGEVQMQRGEKGEWTAAREGMLLRKGDGIKTGAQSSCNINWSRGNVVHLTSFTTMRIDRMDKNPAAGSENSSMQMWMGKVYAQSKKIANAGSSFSVKTPTAVAGVRGTRMAVGVDADETTDVECLDGAVQVKGLAGGEVMLGERQKTTVKKNEAPTAPKIMQKEDEQSFDALEQATSDVLDITQPVGNLETDTTPVTVKGSTSPGNTVTVNGSPAVVDGSGGFTASVELTEGTNQIKIASQNKNGKTTEKTRVVKYRKGTDGEVRLSLTTPEDRYTTRESSVAVTGSVTPANAAVSVNDQPVTVGNGGVFSASVNLIEGENLITALAGLTNGTSQSIARTVTKDTTAPRLDIFQPSSGQFSDDSPGCAFSGTVLRCTIIGRTEFGATVILNGQQVSVQPDGTFTVPITLSVDDKSINVAASDNMGNRSTVVLTPVINLGKVHTLEIAVSPDTITANQVDRAVVTVRTMNILGQPVTGSVTLNVTGGGTLNATTLSTSNGEATTEFIAGVGAMVQTVVITATSGTLSATANLTLLPDVPPEH